jgi:serine O-acetyltransferase
MGAGYGIRLSLSANIGSGFYMGHFGGIELSNCVLGPGCSVGEMTTISSAAPLRGPTIGARVWIGGHVRISGAVSVGDDATIGSGARIASDVPPRALMMGSPARMISRDYDNTRIL